MSNSSSDKKVIAASLATIALWASAFVGTRLSVRYLSPEPLALYRYVLASLALGLYAFVIRKEPLPAKRDLPFLILTGFIGLTLYMLLFNAAHARITAATGAFLIGSSPIFTSLFSAIYLKERIRPKTLAGILISFFGIALICFSEKEDLSLNIGVLLMLGAALLLSLNNVMLKKLSRKYNAVQITSGAIISGTCFLFCFTPALFREIGQVPLEIHLTILYLAVFPAAIACILWTWALSKGNTTRVASFMYVTPLLTIIIGWVWIREVPNVLSILGGLIIIAGVVLTNYRQSS